MSHIDEYFDNIIDFVSGSIYWKDKNGIYLGCNQHALKEIRASCKNDLIGKTDYDLFDKTLADQFRANDLKIINENIELSFEEIEVLPDGKKITRLSSKKPLYDNNKQIIGIVGNTIDITAQKELEKLKGEYEEYRIKQKANETIIKEHKKFNKFIDEMQRLMKAYQSSLLNSKIDKNNSETIENYLPLNIKLTEREKSILFFLSLNKSAKEIAKIISTIENKKIEPSTVASVINKQLYPKLDVSTTSALIEKASLCKLLPFMPNDFFDKAKNNLER